MMSPRAKYLYPYKQITVIKMGKYLVGGTQIYEIKMLLLNVYLIIVKYLIRKFMPVKDLQ